MKTATSPEERQAGEMLRAWQTEVFYQFGFPGLSYVEGTPAPNLSREGTGTVEPTPLVKRCACGRAISGNKETCRACITKKE